MLTFSIILTTVITALHCYVLWRAAGLPIIGRRASTRKLVIAGTVLWLLFLFGRFFSHDTEGALAAAVELAGMTWMGALLLLSVSLLAVDGVTLFGLVLPKAALRLRGAAFVLGLVLSLIALAQGMRQPVVENYEVRLAGLPPGLDRTVLIGLSDLHLGPLRDGQWLDQVVSRVLQEKPDVIVLLGDIFEGHGLPSPELAKGLATLNAPMGVWAVLGNHEFHAGADEVVPLFRGAGVTVLRNDRIVAQPGLAFAGVDDLTVNRRSGRDRDLISLAFTKPAPGATILLSHTPWNADRAAKAGAGLMLCGHTHGGQIWPFGYLVKFFYPLLAGRYDVDGMAVIVSRGAGSWGPPMRLWERGQIIKVTLRAGSNTASL